MISREALLNQLQILGCSVEGDEILDKCVELCVQLNKNEEEFVDNWVAFSASNYGDFDLTLDRLEQMLKYEKLHNITVEKKKDSIAESSTIRNQTNFDDEEDILKLYGFKQELPSDIKKPSGAEEESSASLNANKRLTDIVQSPSTVTKKSTPKSYKDSGKILLTFGQKVQSWKNGAKSKSIICRGEQNHISSDATYGFELLSDKIKSLHIVNQSIGEELCAAWSSVNPVDISYTSYINIVTQKPLRTWGRIHSKCETGKTTLYLEGCNRLIEQKESELDKRENVVELDLSHIASYSFYPGQIVAVQAINPTGGTLVVQHIFEGHLLKKATKNNLSENLRLIVASGPFSTLDNLDCEPLFELLDRVTEDEPHVLLLAGPFIDCSHPELKEHKSSTFQELFNATITRLMDKLEGKNTQVVIVSSHRDIHHDPVYPTPEYSLPKTFTNLHLMPDPCTMCIDGLIISMTTVDSIMHLGRAEITFKPTNNDKLGRLANYILSQGFFYPLYPPAEEISLDTTLWQQHAYMETSPHLLILPSDMRHFCKSINDTVVVNPERLNKRTYSRIEVRPSNNNVWSPEQVSCEILKL